MAITQASRYESALGRSQAQYNQMIAEMQAAKGAAAEPIAPELTETVESYRAGGTYGTGQRAIVEEQLKGGLSANQAALIRSGMSSGSASTGLRNRYSKDISTAFQTIEEGRTDKLNTALAAVATAREARGMRIGNAYTTTAQLIGGFKEPTVTEFMNAEEIQAAETASQKEQLGMQLTSQEKQLVLQLAAQKSIASKQAKASMFGSSMQYAASARQAQATEKITKEKIASDERQLSSSQKFESGESAKYKLTTGTQAYLAKKPTWNINQTI